MKAVILLNGEPYTGSLEQDGYVYCCDGAYAWAKDKIKIDENVGDFDSLRETPVPPPAIVYPAEKNFTDGEIAVRRAIRADADQIVIYGAFGLRYDHFLGNLHLLYLAYQNGVPARMISEREEIFWGAGLVELNGYAGKTLSIVPFGANAHIMESSGLKYPLHELDLVYGSTRGISNIAERDEAHVFAQGCVLVIVNRGGEH